MKIMLGTESTSVTFHNVKRILRAPYSMYDQETGEMLEDIDTSLELIIVFDNGMKHSYNISSIEELSTDHGTDITLKLNPDDRKDWFFIHIMEGGTKEDLNVIREYFELVNTHYTLL